MHLRRRQGSFALPGDQFRRDRLNPRRPGFISPRVADEVDDSCDVVVRQMAKGGHAAVILLHLDRQWAADAVQYDEHRESLVRDKIGIAGKRREISRLPSPLGTMARRTVLLPAGLAVR